MNNLRRLFSLAIIAFLFHSQDSLAQTLQPSSDGRHLQWSNGTPIFLLSDTAWLLPARYSNSEVQSYLTSRASQGFTAIQMTACFPENGYQDVNTIFTGGDLSRPVASYWTHVDWVVNQATSRGLIVILNPFWKKTSDTWLANNGATKCRAYGKWIATRYRNNPHVAYFIGGDSKPEPIRAEMNSMGLGVQDAYSEVGLPKAIIAYHGAPDQTSREAFATETWLTLDWIYSYAPPFGNVTPYQKIWADWVKSPAKPMQFGEGFYDRGDVETSRWGNRWMCRKQSWWSTVGGAIGGYAYGAEAIWFHNFGSTTWQTAVNYDSGKDVVRLKNFLSSLEWWKLQPDINHNFLTAGMGTFGAIDYALASVASDKSFAVVYTPVAHTLTLKMPASGAPYTLRWFDPTNGTFRSGSTTAASGASVSMATPGNNSQGKQDWVILASTGTTTTPPPIANGTYKIINRLSGKALDSVGSSTANGTKIEQWTYLAGSDQKWTVTSLGGGEYSIVQVASGKALDIVGASTANGALAQIWTVTGATNQKWTFTATSGGYYTIAAVHSGKVLDVQGASIADGGVVEQWSSNGGGNQQWILQAP